MRNSLFDVLGTRVLLADGAMGTQLQAAGLPVGACGESWNVDAPEKVLGVQRRYADAGSDLILTNTFGGSRLALERHSLGERTAEINLAAARVAREAIGEERWVLGDIGPFGGMIEPYGDTEPEEVFASFLEQARALVKGGVDGLIVETMTALEELEQALRAARLAIDESGKRIPLFGSMAYDHAVSGPPRTMMGVDPESAARSMVELGADVVGCNCGTKLDIEHHAEILRLYRSAAPKAVLMSQPNAGSPEMVEGRIVYREEPGTMAERMALLVEAGAGVLGGCCGTTPEHIALFRRELDRLGGGRVRR